MLVTRTSKRLQTHLQIEIFKTNMKMIIKLYRLKIMNERHFNLRILNSNLEFK